MEHGNNRKSDRETVYELSFLLLPSLAYEQVSSSFDSIKGIVKELDGQVLSDENPVLIDLAYAMTKVVGAIRHKVTTAYLGWIKFEIQTEKMETLKKAIDGDSDILRYLIIKTVKENTLLNGKMMFRKENNAPEDSYDTDGQVDTPEVVKEIVPEELDKSIDDLVIA